MNNQMGIEAAKIKFEAEKMKLKEEREQRIKEFWENGIPKLNNPEDVPTLPNSGMVTIVSALSRIYSLNPDFSSPNTNIGLSTPVNTH